MIENITFTSTDHTIESLYENYKFEYELYLIEANTFSIFGKIDTQLIQESYDEIIQESIKETLTLWITRFTEATQKALDRFLEIIDGRQDAAYLSSIEPNVKALNQDPGFSVNNIRNYKDDAINNFNLVRFSDVFSTKKDSLQNQEQFLIQNYGNLGFAQGKTDIKEVIESSIVTIVTDQVNVTAELIRGYYNWCRNDYKNDLSKIQNLMNTYNESTKSISTVINELPDDYRDQNQTQDNNLVTPKTNKQNVNAAYSFLLQEAPGDPTPTQPTISNTQSATANNDKASNKMTFDDKVDVVAKNKGVDSNQETVNAIRTYLSCTTRILSTLFIIIKNRKADYMRVLKHLFPMNREQRQTAQATTNITNNNTSQVDTSKFPK